MAETPWLPSATWNQVNDAMPPGQKFPDKVVQILDERDRSIIFPDNTADVHPYPASFRIAGTTLAQPGGYTYASQTFSGLTPTSGATATSLNISMVILLSMASSHTADHWVQWTLLDGSNNTVVTSVGGFKPANYGSYNYIVVPGNLNFSTSGVNTSGMKLKLEVGLAVTLTYSIDAYVAGTLSWVGGEQTLT